MMNRPLIMTVRSIKFLCSVKKNLYPDGMKVERAFEEAANFYQNFQMDQALEMAKQFGLKTRKKINTLSTGYTSIFAYRSAECYYPPICC